MRKQLPIKELLTLIRNVKSDRPSNVTEIYFVRKQKQAYRSFKPQMSADVQQDILEMILPVLEGQLERLHLVNYNPIGVADEETHFSQVLMRTNYCLMKKISILRTLLSIACE